MVTQTFYQSDKEHSKLHLVSSFQSNNVGFRALFNLGDEETTAAFSAAEYRES